MSSTFDTNALLSSTLWDGSVAQKLLFREIKSGSTIFSSTAILNEYQEILKRDFGYSDEEITKIMEKVLALVTIVEPTEKIDVLKEDPEDNMILECAVASSSEYIVTYDKHLLKIKEFRGRKILTPDELIKLIY